VIELAGDHPLLAALVLLTLFAGIYQAAPWTKK
jgi:hypothetical protein